MIQRPGISQVAFRDMREIPVHRQAMLQRIAGDSVEPAASIHVHRTPLPITTAPAVVESGVKAVKVVEARIENVDAPEVAPAVVIPREKRLSKAQRTPAESETKSKTSIPRHQSGRVPASCPATIIGARRPSPITAEAYPAAVMEGSKSPGSVVDPGPSPRIFPDPISVGVRRPVGSYAIRDPDIAVIRSVAPGSIGVEIFRSNHVRRNVLAGAGRIGAPVPALAPLIEAIRIRSGVGHVSQRISIGKTHLCVRLHAYCRTLSAGLAFASPDRHHGRIPVGINI